MASPYELLESTQELLFPPTYSVQNIIPLWMRFNVFSYSENALVRYNASLRGRGDTSIPFLDGNLLANITVPAQISFIATTAVGYGKKVTDAALSTPSLYGLGDIKQAIDNFVGYFADKVESTVERGMKEFGYGESFPEADVYDLAYVGGGPTRSYNVSILLPCFNEADSNMASDIAQAFEAYSLPSASSWGNIANTKFYHPPLWSFGITKSLNSLVYDKSWTGQPQLSVLQTVKTKRVPLESNSLSGIGNNIRPMVYSISLAFSELEPAVRVSGSQITSRSGIISAGRALRLGVI